jgi:hypothetical protein
VYTPRFLSQNANNTSSNYCPICITAKARRTARPLPSDVTKRAQHPWQDVSVDLSGKMRIQGISNVYQGCRAHQRFRRSRSLPATRRHQQTHPAQTSTRMRIAHWDSEPRNRTLVASSHNCSLGSHLAGAIRRIRNGIERGAVDELCPLVGIADSNRRESKKSHGGARGHHGHCRPALVCGQGCTAAAFTHTQTQRAQNSEGHGGAIFPRQVLQRPSPSLLCSHQPLPALCGVRVRTSRPSRTAGASDALSCSEAAAERHGPASSRSARARHCASPRRSPGSPAAEPMVPYMTILLTFGNSTFLRSTSWP